jgi:hypothetical protein
VKGGVGQNQKKNLSPAKNEKKKIFPGVVPKKKLLSWKIQSCQVSQFTQKGKKAARLIWCSNKGIIIKILIFFLTNINLVKKKKSFQRSGEKKKKISSIGVQKKN